MRSRLRSCRGLRGAIVLAGALLMTGCVTLTTPRYQPSVANIELLESSASQPVAVGKFQASAGVPNQEMSVRGNGMRAGSATGTFSGYLHDALIKELKTAGLYVPKSSTQVQGELVRNEINAGVGSDGGSAMISARFEVLRHGRQIYNKTLSAKQNWDSSFIGAIAIPTAVRNYPVVVQKLLAELFGDPAFMRAIAKPNATTH